MKADFNSKLKFSEPSIDSCVFQALKAADDRPGPPAAWVSALRMRSSDHPSSGLVNTRRRLNILLYLLQ